MSTTRVGGEEQARARLTSSIPLSIHIDTGLEGDKGSDGDEDDGDCMLVILVLG